MKFTNTLKPLLIICCLILSSQVVSQTYTIPSQERVNELLESINYCKDLVQEWESYVVYIEENPDDFTLKQYNRAKEHVEKNKKCLAQNRKLLDDIRKEFPGWFNSPSTIIPIERNHETTPRELELDWTALEDRLLKLEDFFKKLSKPEK